jgi:hypothetical protein
MIEGLLFPYRECHRVTWVSPDNETENQINHLTISRQWRSSLCDVRNRRGAGVGSDHHLVTGEIKLKIAVTTKINQSGRSRFDTQKLNDPKIAESFKLELRNLFQMLREDDSEERESADINMKYNKIRDVLNELCKNVLGYKENKRKEWIRDTMWKNLLERRNLKAKINAGKTRREG